MKKIFFMAMFALTIVIAFTGCEKENLFSTKSKAYTSLPTDIQKLYDRMPHHKYGTIKVIDNNILCFETKEQYENIADLLLRDCEIWDSLFYNTYSYMTEKELAAWEEQIGYNEFLPLLIFEENYGVAGRMLFDNQQAAMQSWMDNGMEGADPSDNIFNIEADQAMFNPNHEICVNDTIYQFRPDALVLIPISMLSQWTRYRGRSTNELVGRFIVKKDGNGTVNYDDITTMPAHCNFVFENDFTTNNISVSDFPNEYSGKDYSHWSVIGRRGLNWSHVMTSKLVNYKFDGLNNQGQNKYKKIRRSCSIITHQTFSTEQYEQLYQSFQCWGADPRHDVLSPNKNIKTFVKRIRNQYVPINYLSHDYKFGIFVDGATVEIRVGNVYPSKILPLF